VIADRIPLGLIEIQHAPAFYDALNERIVEHVVSCNICRPGVRCTQYISLAEIRNDLSFVEGKNQDDQKN
jgi:hypothetical protein